MITKIFCNPRSPGLCFMCFISNKIVHRPVWLNIYTSISRLFNFVSYAGMYHMCTGNTDILHACGMINSFMVVERFAYISTPSGACKYLYCIQLWAVIQQCEVTGWPAYTCTKQLFDLHYIWVTHTFDLYTQYWMCHILWRGGGGVWLLVYQAT